MITYATTITGPYEAFNFTNYVMIDRAIRRISEEQEISIEQAGNVVRFITWQGTKLKMVFSLIDNLENNEEEFEGLCEDLIDTLSHCFHVENATDIFTEFFLTRSSVKECWMLD